MSAGDERARKQVHFPAFSAIGSNLKAIGQLWRILGSGKGELLALLTTSKTTQGYEKRCRKVELIKDTTKTDPQQTKTKANTSRIVPCIMFELEVNSNSHAN
jgi:hypothetical protein